MGRAIVILILFSVSALADVVFIGRGPATEGIFEPSRFSDPSMEFSERSAPEEKKPMDLIPNRYKGVQEIAIIVNDIGFFPQTVFVNKGIPVRIFLTGATHKKSLCFMMDEFKVHKQITSKEVEEISFIPQNAGKHRFYCPVNGATGTLVVRELASIY